MIHYECAYYPHFLYFRDLGERLRQFVAAEFPHGPISNANEGKLSKDFDSFNRIANNEYRDRFPRKYPGTTVLGLELEEYKFATSNEGLAFINGEYQKRYVFKIKQLKHLPNTYCS